MSPAMFAESQMQKSGLKATPYNWSERNWSKSRTKCEKMDRLVGPATVLPEPSIWHIYRNSLLLLFIFNKVYLAVFVHMLLFLFSIDLFPTSRHGEDLQEEFLKAFYRGADENMGSVVSCRGAADIGSRATGNAI